MKIQTETVGGVAIMRIVGEFDSRSNTQIDTAIKDLSYTGSNFIVIDLAMVRFMGIQTLNVIISNLKEVRAGGGDIRFLNPHKRVVDYLKQNRLFEIFQIFTTRREAVESFGPPEEKKSARDRVQVDKDASVISDESSSASGSSSGAGAAASPESQVDFESGSVLFANSCMIASTIHLLKNKGVLTEEEADTLLGYDSLAFIRESIASDTSEKESPEPSSQ